MKKAALISFSLVFLVFIVCISYIIHLNSKNNFSKPVAFNGNNSDIINIKNSNEKNIDNKVDEGNVFKKVIYTDNSNIQKQNNNKILSKMNLPKVLFSDILFPIIILVIGILFIDYMKKQAIVPSNLIFAPDYMKNLPSSLMPAEVALLFYFYEKCHNRNPKFIATLLNLNLKDFVRFRKDDKKDKIIIEVKKDNDTSTLDENEKIIFDFISVNVAGNRSEINLGDIISYVKNNRSIVRGIYQKFCDKSMKKLGEAELIDIKVKKKYDKILTSVKAAMALSIVLAIINLNPILVLVLIFLLVSLIKSPAINKLTSKGENELALWTAYKNFLKDLNLLDEKELPDVETLEKYLSYAVVLGEENSVIRTLTRKYSNLPQEHHEKLNMMCKVISEGSEIEIDLSGTIN